MKRYSENIFNPVVFYGVGLFPVLTICTGLEVALKFSLLLIITMLLCNLIVNAFKPILVKEVRIPCYIFLVIGVEYLLDSIIFEFWAEEYVGIMPLLTMLFTSAIIIYMLEETTDKPTFKDSFVTCIKMALEYCVCMVIIGFVREILGSGSVWGKRIGNFVGLPFFNSFAGGLLLLMVYTAIYSLVARRVKERRVAFLGLVDRYTLLLENAGEEFSERQNETEESNDDLSKEELKAIESDQNANQNNTIAKEDDNNVQ